jgi:predicted transglutaminase-like cysteine proteinase
MKLFFHYKLLIVIVFLLFIWVTSGCVAPREIQSYFNTKEAQASSISISIPVGPAYGDENQVLTFTVDARSNLSGSITYGFYWGDGSYNWENRGLASHSWSEPGIYIIRAQARCGDGHSEWSKCKVIMIGSGAISRSPLSNMEQARKYVKYNDEQVQSLVQIIREWAKKWSYNDFDAIREWVTTNIAYQSDSELFKVVDYWQFPVETIESGAGDCEDIAILLCSLLRAFGVAPEEVYVAVGNLKGTNEAHAYVFEHRSKGIWRVIEPQVNPILSNLTSDVVDWALTYDYNGKLICFNDKYMFSGLPTTATGVYELGVGQSLWPFTTASIKLERQIKKDESIIGLFKWLGVENILFDYDFKIYDPENNVLLYKTGKDIEYSFSIVAQKAGIYAIEIVKKDFAPRYARLKLSPTEWKIVKTSSGK